MTGNQIRWAMQHDWFSAFGQGVNGYVVYVVDRCKGMEDKLVAFNDYQELRIWAGY